MNIWWLILILLNIKITVEYQRKIAKERKIKKKAKINYSRRKIK